jgi:hypothetical protein
MQLSLFTDKAICQGCQQEKAGVEFSHEIQKWLCDECQYPKKIEVSERTYPEVTAVGPWGVKWRGEDVPEPNSMYENDYTSIFGFTCAGCGVSVVNQEQLYHKPFCDSKNPHKTFEERKENESI